jgi:lysozyme
MIKINSDCIFLIKSWEGLFLKAYHGEADRPGVDTIGYGTIKYPPNYLGGKMVKVGDAIITEGQAVQFLQWEVNKILPAVDTLLRDDLTENQFGALVSFCYNVGVGALKMSHLRSKINANPHDPSIRDEFMKWDMSNGVHVRGLARRRKSEADLYFKR